MSKKKLAVLAVVAYAVYRKAKKCSNEEAGC